MAFLCSANILGQGTDVPFITISEHINHNVTAKAIQSEEMQEATFANDSTVMESSCLMTNGYSNLSIEEFERLIALYENYLLKKRGSTTLTKNNNSKILNYYNGDSHELTLTNLISVIEEVGLNNQLFVLAQAVLETGNFTSSVCKNYHNLFGLYDSKHKDYYHFARWEDSVIGYQRFIQYRYNGGNYLQFLRRIGYAEDPRYTTKVAQIAKQLYKRLFNQL
ncbi:glucosaminidase domain-containing protein [Prevotella sp.]|uniref:glucosaminidase domain-containing protein n=1 Tax=Prevotella sp. TaxID=59823 RepID=UPI003AB949E7